MIWPNPLPKRPMIFKRSLMGVEGIYPLPIQVKFLEVDMVNSKFCVITEIFDRLCLNWYHYKQNKAKESQINLQLGFMPKQDTIISYKNLWS